ncbi:hypothetical protein HK405_000013 [Cladochytrium tenue]|nr:hypothetical protein HK405_000013 [Cladochytrium tenue]
MFSLQKAAKVVQTARKFVSDVKEKGFIGAATSTVLDRVGQAGLAGKALAFANNVREKGLAGAALTAAAGKIGGNAGKALTFANTVREKGLAGAAMGMAASKLGGKAGKALDFVNNVQQNGLAGAALGAAAAVAPKLGPAAGLAAKALSVATDGGGADGDDVAADSDAE